MKRIMIAILMMAGTVCGYCQEPYIALAERILSNSVDMQVLVRRSMADSAMAVGGSLFDNPEIEFAYYAGSPASVGMRWDFSVTQPLRLPSYYLSHKRQRKLKQDEAHVDMRLGRRALLSKIETLCSDMVMLNVLYRHYSQCEAKARTLSDVYKQRLDEGTCTVIEYNSIMVSQAQLHGRVMETDIKRHEKMSELSILNGGRTIDFVQDTFSLVSLPEDIERYADSVVSYGVMASHRGVVDRQYANAVDMARREWLPCVGVGYASENTTGETFRGGVLTLSLPLWNNARQVGSALMASQSVAEQHSNEQRVERQQLLQCYHKATMLQKTIEALQRSMSIHDSELLLNTALQAGEITVQQYLQQWEEFHDAQTTIYELQHELEHTVIQLYSME